MFAKQANVIFAIYVTRISIKWNMKGQKAIETVKEKISQISKYSDTCKVFV